MCVERLHFLDTLNFLSMYLKNMPKSFDLTCTEYYSRLFDMFQNLDYGPLSRIQVYRTHLMSGEERAQFLAWCVKQNDLIFHNKYQLLAYCMDDVNVLGHA
jgi:hypothetical protein